MGTRKLFEILHFFVICDLLFTHNINEYDCISNTLFYTKMKDLDNSKLLLPPANEVCEGYVFTGVCLSVHRGVSAPLHAGIHTPPGQTPPCPVDCSCYCLNQASLTIRTRGRAGKFPVGGETNRSQTATDMVMVIS